MKKIGFIFGRLFILFWPLIILFIFRCLMHPISEWWTVIAVLVELLVLHRVLHRGVEVIGKNDPFRIVEENDDC